MGEKKGLLSFFKVDSLFEHLTSFIESKVEIYKIEIKEEVAQSLSKMMIVLLFFFIGTFFFLFLNIALGYYLGALLESLFLGFLIISGFYLLVFLVLYLLRDQFKLEQFFEKKVIEWLKLDKKYDDE